MKNVLLLLFVILTAESNAQYNKAPQGGGMHQHLSDVCISELERQQLKTDLQISQKELYKKGLLPMPKKTRNVSLIWPVKQATGFYYCSYYGISNFVDHNLSAPNQLQDYNCGARTYDLNSGTNHAGTDIFLWPFEWNMVDADQVEAVAAADGVIIYKADGNPHTSCNFSNANWNVIVVQHSDGSVAWYGHLKNGSVNAKPVGGSVVAGEKLGVVASSGFSTGPHLHFELYDANSVLVDPYSGPCNTITSWWAAQKPYYESSINAALTHSGAPIFNACPNAATTNVEVNFQPGDNIVFAGYYHDQVNNSTATYTVYRPDGSIYSTWSQTFNIYYSASYWYWYDVLPANAPSGNWIFSIEYNGQTCNKIFQVGGIAPFDVENISLQVMPLKNANKIFWHAKELNNVQHFEIEKSQDGQLFEKWKKVIKINNAEYFEIDNEPFETTYYRVKIMYDDFSTKYSNVVKANLHKEQKFIFFPNPVNTTIHFNEKVSGKILEISGKKVIDFENKDALDIQYLANGMYFLEVDDEYYRFTVNR